MRAPATGRSSGSRIRPVTGPAKREVGRNRERTNVQKTLTRAPSGVFTRRGKTVRLRPNGDGETARCQVSWLAGRYGISGLPKRVCTQWLALHCPRGDMPPGILAIKEMHSLL